jgi:sigma54-dependent transcription regulator
LYCLVWAKLKEQLEERWPIDGGLEENALAVDRLRAHIRASLNRHSDAHLAGFIQIHMRERVNPTGLLDEEMEKLQRINEKHMRSLIRDLLGEDVDEVDVDLCEMSVINQFSILRPPRSEENRRQHTQHRPNRFSASDVDRLADHITTFCMGGIEAVRQNCAIRKKQS